MKYYRRKPIYIFLWLISGTLFFISAVLQFQMKNYNLGLLQILVALLSLFDAYVYSRPYLGLGEGKLILNNGLIRNEIALGNITLLNENKKRLVITYNNNLKTKKRKIELSILREKDKEEFLSHFKSDLGK